jgi:predicted RNA-binding Zn ribbon-like protein
LGESAGYQRSHPKVDRPAGSALFEEFPELWGRWPCLDFVNSLMSDHRGSGKVFDLMPLPGWQNAFLSLWKMSLDDPFEVAPLTVMVKVRRVVRDGLERWGRGERLPEADARDLNTILGLAPLSRAVSAGESGYSVELAPSTRNWTWVLTEVIVSMFRLMEEGDPARLRKCANPDCTWLYHDDSQAHSRRWCSPRACGNMVRVRAFRSRRRQTSRP